LTSHFLCSTVNSEHSDYSENTNFSERGLKMAKKPKKIKKNSNSCCGPVDKGMGCCSVESVISVDDRGQMVLPKEIRDKANIKPGDKLTVVSMEKDGKVCCISLIKTEEFAEMVKGLLGPMMKDLVTK
jgi:AbrB family looped-hinge helix DNA binding protein